MACKSEVEQGAGAQIRESALSAGKYAEVRAGAEAVKPSPLVQKGMEVCT